MRSPACSTGSTPPRTSSTRAAPALRSGRSSPPVSPGPSPGANRIAGTYHGVAEVLGYFQRRRHLASGTFQQKRRDILTGAGSRVAALTDGVATISNVTHRWSTVGLYDLTSQRVTACWPLPLDQQAFDAIWTA